MAGIRNSVGIALCASDRRAPMRLGPLPGMVRRLVLRRWVELVISATMVRQ
jgi:hypothetical protein